MKESLLQKKKPTVPQLLEKFSKFVGAETALMISVSFTTDIITSQMNPINNHISVPFTTDTITSQMNPINNHTR
jgi:hypothetical protein